MKLQVKVKGSAYSGNYGHAGIPGHQGGSAPRGGSGFQTFPNAEKAESYAMENLGGNVGTTAVNKKVVDNYRVYGMAINSALRKDKPLYDPIYQADRTNQNTLDRLDELMNLPEAIVSKGVTVQRGFGDITPGPGLPRVKFFADKAVGDVFQDKGFVSTSVDPDFRWQKGTMVTIRVPPGARGLYIGRKEKEFLLNRGTSFRVVQNDTNGIILEVIP